MPSSQTKLKSRSSKSLVAYCQLPLRWLSLSWLPYPSTTFKKSQNRFLGDFSAVNLDIAQRTRFH